MKTVILEKEGTGFRSLTGKPDGKENSPPATCGRGGLEKKGVPFFREVLQQ